MDLFNLIISCVEQLKLKGGEQFCDGNVYFRIRKARFEISSAFQLFIPLLVEHERQRYRGFIYTSAKER
jgi:hypothetical protein